MIRPSISKNDLPSLAETMLIGKMYSLTAEGYTGKALQAKLEEANKEFDPPASQDFLLELLEPYIEKEPMLSPIEIAIASDDVKELFNVAPLLAQLTPLEWGIAKQEIKERYGKRVNMNDLTRAVKDEERKRKIQEEGLKRDIADIARDWASEHRDTWGYDSEYDVWRVWNGVFWIEQPKSHLLDKEAVAALQAASINISSLSALKCFERLVEADCLRDFPPNSGLINFDNGTLDLNTGILRGYWKEDHLTYCLTYCYNPHGSHPNIDKFLYEVLPDEYARLALMAHAGLALMGDMNIHFFYVLVGKPRSGKTTILALLNALCGALDAFSFAGHSIFSRDIEGKRSRFKWSQRPIVCVDELPQEALREEELLKAMTAHSGVEMRGLNRDEHTSNRWKPKLIMATNDQPRYKDNSSAIKERSIFVEITRARPKEARDARLFIDKLLPELGAFAATCLEIAAQVLVRGYFPLSAGMKELIDRIANEGNPLKAFLQEQCIVDGSEKAKIPTAILYNAYESYCKQNGYQAKFILSTNSFSTNLKSMNIGITPKHIRYGNDGKLQRGLVGIRLRNESDPEEAQVFYVDDLPLTRPNRVTHINDVNELSPKIMNSQRQTVETRGDSMLTALTVKEGNLHTCETPTLYNGHQEPLQGRCFSKNEVGSRKPYTVLTGDVIEPVETEEEVNIQKNRGIFIDQKSISLERIQEFISRPCSSCGGINYTIDEDGRLICPCYFVKLEESKKPRLRHPGNG